MKLTLSHFVLKCISVSVFSFFSLNAYADWECYVADDGGHFWKSTGMTQERAVAVAKSFCSSYSPMGGTCHEDKCFDKSEGVGG
jgi:hypothetical protein